MSESSKLVNTGNAATGRTLDDVEHTVALARFPTDGLKPLAQSLTISNSVNNNNIKLMEVDGFLLERILCGESLCVRGDPNESAVICTRDRTYELKEADTSNSCLLLPQWKWPESIDGVDSASGRIVVNQEIQGICHSYFELRRCKPRVRKLRQLLEGNPFRGKEYETESSHEIDGQRYTLEELENVVQASSCEIQKALQEMQACFINGYVRILDFDYKFRVFSFIANLVDSNSWPLDRIPLKNTLDILDELEPRDIIEQCLKWYAHDTELKSEDGDELYRLDEDNVCRLYAEVLLRPARKFNLQEFLESWQNSVPEGMVTDLLQLKGLALTDLNSVPQVIFFYPTWDLPQDPGERFQALFTVRQKWSKDDLIPYLEDLASEDKELNILLAKFARTSKQNGVLMYSSKKPLQI